MQPEHSDKIVCSTNLLRVMNTKFMMEFANSHSCPRPAVAENCLEK